MTKRVGLCGMAATMLLMTAAARSADNKNDPAAHQDAPGPVHKQLAKLAGEYTTITRFRGQPDAEAQESKGNAKLTSILGGRFLSEENSGTMLGQPFKGLRLIGFNNATQKYEATWLYTGSTARMTLVGASPDHGKTIRWTATVDQGKDSRMTLYVLNRHKDADHFVIELYMQKPDGKKAASLETIYTRKK